MPLGIIESATKFADDMSSGMVHVESSYEKGEFPKAFDELNHTDCRNLAMRFASQSGMGATRINGQTIGPFPVNNQGVPLDEVRDPADPKKTLPATHPLMQPSRYRMMVPVCRPLG